MHRVSRCSRLFAQSASSHRERGRPRHSPWRLWPTDASRPREACRRHRPTLATSVSRHGVRQPPAAMRSVTFGCRYHAVHGRPVEHGGGDRVRPSGRSFEPPSRVFERSALRCAASRGLLLLLLHVPVRRFTQGLEAPSRQVVRSLARQVARRAIADVDGSTDLGSSQLFAAAGPPTPAQGAVRAVPPGSPRVGSGPGEDACLQAAHPGRWTVSPTATSGAHNRRSTPGAPGADDEASALSSSSRRTRSATPLPSGGWVRGGAATSA